MGGCRCSYKNCANTTKTRENLHFFHYPVKQKERCKKWIENAQKPQFYDLDEDQLRNKVVCETHFEDCFFPNMQKKRLLQGAIPTLEGDCEPMKPMERSIKIQDVQVLPANADGTIFVLETNMQNNYQSEKVESYIYTNNGLVLPLNKHDSSDDTMQTMLSEEEVDDIGDFKLKNSDFFSNSRYFDSVKSDKEVEQYVITDSQVSKNKTTQESNEGENANKTEEEIFTKSIGEKYVKKIKQHSKDIALLKRLLKTRKIQKKPSNTASLLWLKKQIPPSLLSLVNMNINQKYDPTPADLEFFSTIYATSPKLLDILKEKYKWNVPDPQIFKKNTD